MCYKEIKQQSGTDWEATLARICRKGLLAVLITDLDD